jgi:hypothetical protein
LKSLLLLIALLPSSSQAAFRTVCASGCTYTTLTSALTSGSTVSGDTLVLTQDITESVALTTGNYNKALIYITSDSTRRTWNATSGNTFDLATNGATFRLSNLNMDHSSGGGYTVYNNNNGNAITYFYNVTLKRTDASTTNNAVYYCNACNNNNQLIQLSRSALVGTANTYGIRVESANNNNPVVMANSLVGDFSNASFPAVYINKGDQAGGLQAVNCTLYNNSVAVKYNYNGANTNAASYVQNCLFVGNTTDVVWNSGTGNGKQFYKYNAFAAQGPDSQLSTGNILGITGTNEVTNLTAGSEDLHLLGSALSIDRGLGANATADDFEGTPKNGVRDIGA